MLVVQGNTPASKRKSGSVSCRVTLGLACESRGCWVGHFVFRTRKVATHVKTNTIALEADSARSF